MHAGFPMADHPGVTRMRMIPVAAHPNPVSTPFPSAANPDVSRVGSNRNDFNLWRRRFARLFHHDFAAGWRLLDINDTTRLAFDNAAGKQWQTGGNYHSFYQDGIFHTGR